METLRELKRLLNILKGIHGYYKFFNIDHLILIVQLKQTIKDLLEENQGKGIDAEMKSLCLLFNYPYEN